MTATTMNKFSRIGLLATALLASCGGGGGDPAIEAFNTIHVTDIYADNRDYYDYFETFCSGGECTMEVEGETSTFFSIDDFAETDLSVGAGSSNVRRLGQVNGIEIGEAAIEDRNNSGTGYGGVMDHGAFAAFVGRNTPTGLNMSFGFAVGQASEYAPETTTARYDGAWASVFGADDLDYGAATLVYRFIGGSGDLDAYFYADTVQREQDVLAEFRGIDVNALGKFRQRPRRHDFIEGSFFGEDADEIGGVVQWEAEGGLRVLGAFGAGR